MEVNLRQLPEGNTLVMSAVKSKQAQTTVYLICAVSKSRMHGSRSYPSENLKIGKKFSRLYWVMNMAIKSLAYPDFKNQINALTLHLNNGIISLSLSVQAAEPDESG